MDGPSKATQKLKWKKSKENPSPAESPRNLEKISSWVQCNLDTTTRNLKISAELTKQTGAKNVIWAAKSSKKDDHQK